MKVYLVHHVEDLQVQDPNRHISPKGEEQAARLGARLAALGVRQLRILHSEKQWSIDTAVGIAAKMGPHVETAKAAYPVLTGDPIEPFMSEIAATRGDIMMCGHYDYLLRSASKLVCGNETCKVIDFKPGNGTLVCIEGAGGDWIITFMWRDAHPPG